jgi:amino acid adenylation domain-containing protein
MPSHPKNELTEGLSPSPARPGTVEPSRASILALAPAERRGALLAWLRRLVARAARLPAMHLHAATPLTALGLDSLAAVELGQALADRLEVTVALTDLLDGMTADELVDEILKALAAAPTASGPAAALADRSGEGPLSYGQSALWFLHSLAPESAAYHIAVAARVRSPLGSPLDTGALRRALEAVAARHGALRTSFPVQDGEPRQRVSDRAVVGFSVASAAGWSADELQARIEEAAWRPFDLAAGPLLRAAVFAPLDSGGSALVLAVHHAVADFASMAILARELGALYAADPADPANPADTDADAAGGPSALPEAPAVSYLDFARRQRALLAGEEGERLWTWWRDRLLGAPLRLDLPVDRRRPAVQTYAGAAVSLHLSPQLTAAARALAGARGATLYAVLLSAFEALLHRHTGQEDLLVGSPAAGRTRSELQGVLGYFVNPVVLRADLSRLPSFATLLERTRRDVLGALDHQDFPLPLLVERLQPERDPSRSPLFQALFVWQQGRDPDEAALGAFALGEPGARWERGGLRLESMALRGGSSQVDLTLSAAALQEGLTLQLRYNTDLFAAGTARRTLGHLATLLAGAVAEPERAVAELPLLTPAERRQLLAWNATGVARGDRSLHALFEEQADRVPEAVALVDGDRNLTYRALEEGANRLAAHLRGMGVVPETRVGVLLARTLDLPVTLLGILKAGAAYVPLDPAYPQERLAFQLDDSGAALVVSRRDLESRLAPAAGPRRMVRLDGDAGEIARRSPGRPAPAACPENLAYLIYTSGSTGRPKGVAIEHRRAAAMVRWAGEVFPAADLAGVLFSTSIGFDLSIFELFAPLVHGGRVILAANVLELPALAAVAAVRLVNTVPSALAELLAAGALPPGVRTVCLAGEPLPGALARRIYATGTVTSVWNLYGPSEDTTYSTGVRVPSDLPDSPEAAAEPSIGRPLPGRRAEVLDHHGMPAPVGVPGELYLGGAGLARGYLGRPERTAERFVPAPEGEPGERLYRTGDRVRLRPDGELEFLGRLDHQVKIRGYRIELGEVESALARQEGVAEAVVVAREDASGDRRLVAYVVPTAALPAGWATELRAGLRERLPEVMVPADFVVFKTLPRTPNGKLDRRALPAPERGAEPPAGVSPGRPLVELVAALFAGVLGVDHVGPDDSFFDRGGHSLKAMQVVSRVRRALGVELPLPVLFQQSTAAGLARWLEGDLRGEPRPPLVATPRHGEAPLSFAQERLWFLERLVPGTAVYHLAGRLRFRGRLRERALGAALAGIVARHEALRTSFVEGPEGPVQSLAPAVSLALPEIDLLALPAARREAEWRQRAEDWAERPFDLGRAPLLRVLLARLGDEDRSLSMAMHHLVSDGGSLGVLLADLAALYARVEDPALPGLPTLPVQYADYAVWQRRWLEQGLLSTALPFWRDLLAGVPEVLDLPADRPRPAPGDRRGRGGRRTRALPEELRRALWGLARERDATLFLVLLAGFDTLVARWAREERVNVGTVIANRGWGETEGLIGFFANTLVLPGDLRGEPRFADLVETTRKVALAAYAHQELPFESLVEALQPRRDPGRNPLFQVMLAEEEAPAAPALPGLATELQPLQMAVSRFDLTLFVGMGATFSGTVEYSSDLFDAVTAERLLGAFEALLAAAAADPGTSARELSLLREPERTELLTLGEGGPPAPGAARTVGERIAERTALAPDRVAVVSGGEWVTYAGLERRASRLARALRALGVGPEVTVGVGLERGPRLVAALLAVWRAGGAYVPLDPRYPRERLRFMVEDSGAALVLAEAGGMGELAGGGWRVVSCQELEQGELRDDPGAAAAAAPPPEPEALASVIYTSGSTGRPKGVGVRHGAIAALVAWAESAFGAAELAGVLASTSVGFDLSVFELFVPLSLGGTVILAENALALPGLAERQAVTLVNTVPSAAAELVRQGPLPTSVRTVNLAGEALGRDLVVRLYAMGTVERVVNLYGPSEDTTYSTWSALERSGARVPIGRPLPGSRALVLDRGWGLVPVGMPGELCLGGAGLARGYLGRPELTAERFVPDAWGTRAGERLYRTGDLARGSAAGELQYLGRLDGQLKVRGYRIEPGEVEAALRAHPWVEESVVVLREVGGGPALVGYVVPAAGGEVPVGELREYLLGRLPEPMVPSAWVRLGAVPRLPNGKVDRGALPAPELARREGGRREPRTAAEELLAGVFAEVLELAQVGVEEDFFALGGHSLKAMQVVSRVRRALQVELPLTVLFQEPTVAGLARRLEGGLGAEIPPPLVPMPRDGDAPLSFDQERLWFLDQLHPGSPLYVIPLAVRWSGPLSPAVLARSLSAIVRRHEVLRSIFSAAADGPRQVVVDRDGGRCPEVDLRHLSAGCRAAEVRRQIDAEVLRPFDLGTGPLLRTLLFRLANREAADPEENLLLLSLHHIVADGWSLGVLLRELATTYPAFAAGVPARLPELPVQFADFAIWQRRRLAGEVLARQLAFWVEQLDGAPQVLDLPSDRSRPAVPTLRGASVPVRLLRPLVERLAAVARRREATPFMLLLAAFDVLLWRSTRQADLVVGSPVANRSPVEVEGLIGLFVNTLVLRTRLDGELSLDALLDRVRQATLGAYLHQELPFARLVAELQPQRSLVHNPLVQVMLSLLNAPMPAFGWGEAVLRPVEVPSRTAKLDLLLGLRPDGEGLGGTLEYSTDLFDAVTIRRWVEAFERLIEGIVADPRTRLADLPILGAGERHQILAEWAEWNTGSGGTRGVRPCLAGFACQVAAAPDALAVVRADGSGLSYGELDSRSRRLAGFLRQAGVGPEGIVGLMLERSLDTILAVVAVLRAGGVCLPLDPSYPQERLAFLLQDSRPVVLLVHASLLGLLPEPQGNGHPPAICLDRGLPPDGRGFEAVLPTPSPDALAYVLYTSGSTGVPKGVAMRHGSLSNLIEWQLGELPAARRTLQFSPLGFDVSFQEILSTLGSGGTLVLVPEDRRRDPDRLWRFLCRQRIERLFLPFVALQQLAMAAVGAGSLGAASLAEILTAGEQLQVTPQIRSFLAGTGGWLENQYGPTETHVVTRWRLAGDPEPWPDLPPVGRPIARVDAYLLDASLQPVPVGAIGEICIGGAALARGYLGQPGWTAERFLPHPFATTAGAGSRIYRTGDLARRLADGALLFLGREDHQVKIRGFRLDLQEVEVVLLAHPAVGKAAAALLGSGAGDRRLVAFVVASGAGETPPAGLGEELRHFLRGRLPEYAVPQAVVLLEALPLTASGKVDRRSLLALDLGRPVAEDSRGFGSPTEELLAGIWSAVLGRPVLSGDGHFFELGGHSLLATRIVSRARELFHIELPLSTLFSHPTVAELAAEVDRVRATPVPVGLTAPPLLPQTGDAGDIRDMGDMGDPPLSFSQEQLWFLDRLEPGSPVYNFPVGVRLAGILDRAALHATLMRVVERHAILRTCLRAVAGRPVQVVAEHLVPALPPLPEIDLTALAPATPAVRQAEAERRVAAEALTPFDLARGPLFRATLLRLEADHHLLLLTFHHVVLDGWSLRLFFEELAALYAAAVTGADADLPALPIQYADFARWQRAWLRGAVLERLLAYWRQRLAGAPAALELPFDRPRPPVQTYAGSSRPLALDPATTPALRAFAREEGATLFMTLLASFATLLNRFSGEDDLVLGTPTANRNRVELESLLGFFANNMALRLDLASDPTCRDLLGRVRDAVLADYAHQEMPFEKIVEELRPGRDLSHNPIYQVVFALEASTRPDRLDLPGLVVTPLPAVEGTAKFDLAVYMEDRGGRLSGLLEVNRDLFDPATAARLSRSFTALVAALLAEPSRRLSELPLLAPAEWRQLLWVDLRGYRIDLGRIEGALAAHPAIAEAAVVRRADRPGEERLVAYVAAVAARPGSPPADAEELRAFLRRRLPEYMLPLVFVALAALPRTPDGELDPGALPAPEAEPQSVSAAPVSEAERTVVEIWRQILNLEEVGLADNFFALGGHSLLLLPIQERLQERCGVTVAVVDLFKFPTAGALAQHLSGLLASSRPVELEGSVLKLQERAARVRAAGGHEARRRVRAARRPSAVAISPIFPPADGTAEDEAAD